MKDTGISISQLRFAGICGILAGIFVITFAAVAESNGLLFSREVYTGGSMIPWIQNVVAVAGLSKIIMVLPILGFSCFLMVGLVLFQNIKDDGWQKYLGLAGYLIGVPFAIGMWVTQLSIMNYVLLNYGISPELDFQVESLASYAFFFFQVSNDVFGPLFIIVLGSGMISWAALKEGSMPKWLCFWGIGCGVFMLFSFLALINPLFGILSFAAPLHMIWFIVVGVNLMSRAKVLDKR